MKNPLRRKKNNDEKVIPYVPKTEITKPGPVDIEPTTWECQKCGTHIPLVWTICGKCETKRPKKKSKEPDIDSMKRGKVITEIRKDVNKPGYLESLETENLKNSLKEIRYDRWKKANDAKKMQKFVFWIGTVILPLGTATAALFSFYFEYQDWALGIFFMSLGNIFSNSIAWVVNYAKTKVDPAYIAALEAGIKESHSKTQEERERWIEFKIKYQEERDARVLAEKNALTPEQMAEYTELKARMAAIEN